MKIEEAIKIIEDRCMPTACDLYQRPEYCGEIKEALDIAIKALKCQENISTLNIKEGDTIILTIDLDEVDLDFASSYMEGLGRFFPKNTIVLETKGIDMEVSKL